MVKMSPKGGEKRGMESVRLKINEHMTSVGEQILCVLDKQQLDVRVFVLERLSLAAKFICSLLEPLETQLETQRKLLEIDFDMDLNLHTAGLID